ncbi:MAG TPA: AraC family transcriptional regulator [Clostridiaceae bacterium]|nr:AraC family transcriptional regulator [Clostridiaceae bacterium]
MSKDYPVLKGDNLFRKDELVYVNRSDELKEYHGIMHKHDFIEIAYVIDGSGVHIVGENEYETSKGDLFIINYDVPHGFFPKENGREIPVVYNCVFMPEFLDSSLFNSVHFQDVTSSFLFKSLFPDDHAISPVLTLRGTEFSEIGSLFSKMYAEYKSEKKGYCDMIRAYLIELIIKIFRYIDAKKEYVPASRNVELVNKAIQYLKSNYNSEIKLEDLAMKSFISKNYFSKLFREKTGISFSDYVQHIRIDEACNLLRTTDMKVIDIASQVGIKDIKFFYEVFKKITGQTPGEYRKRVLA